MCMYIIGLNQEERGMEEEKGYREENEPQSKTVAFKFKIW